MENTSSDRLLFSSVITAVCIITAVLPFISDDPIIASPHGFTHHLSVNCLIYHFYHANIFHLLINLIALWQFRPRLGTIFVAFAVSSAAACIPFAAIALPTCGLSAFLFACYARNFVAWHRSWYSLIAIQLLCAVIPGINWRIHVLSFFLSYVIWYAYYRYYRHIK